jgi:pimeloyl-ACP methyl ester carboxylesterase
LPPGYAEPGQAQRSYPVIEAFHGIPGSNADYKGRDIDLASTIARSVGRGRLAEPIVVIPDISPGGVDTECTDYPGSTMETWLTSTVPQWLIEHFRVQSTKNSWATLGYSAGGYCAAMAAMLHPSRYGGGVLLGAYFQPDFDGPRPWGKAEMPQRYDLMKVEANAPPPTALWIQIAGMDPMSGRPSSEFAAAARSPMAVTTVTWRHAGHRAQVWQGALPFAFRWLGQTMPGFETKSTVPTR